MRASSRTHGTTRLDYIVSTPRTKHWWSYEEGDAIDSNMEFEIEHTKKRTETCETCQLFKQN